MPNSPSADTETTSNSETRPQSRASRLEPLPDADATILPFLRAQQLNDCSLYWAPVAGFPVPIAQREWWEEFLRRLAGAFKKEYELREEWFLQFKSIYPHLLTQFTKTSNQYYPMTGMTLSPNSSPTATPTFEEVKEAVEESSKEGTPLDVNRWMPDHTFWFAKKRPEQQRKDFFGYGGMFALYLPKDTKTPAMQFTELPRFMKTHPAYSPDEDEELQILVALQDGFLAKSKQLFGEPFVDDPSYRGLLFVLPLLTSSSFVAATSEERELWFGLFDAYLTESKLDNGIVLACKDPVFDKKLASILQSMESDGFKYRH